MLQGRFKVDSRGIIAFLCITCSVIFLYTAAFGQFSAVTQRALLLMLLTPVVFLSKASEEEDSDKVELKKVNLLNVLAIIGIVASSLYVMFTWESKVMMTGGTSTLDLVMGVILIVVVLEATRQSTGLFLTLTAVACILFALLGPIMPGFLAHRGETWDRLVDYFVTSPDGIFGTPLGIASSYIIIFVIFGSFLEAFGGGKLFIDVAYAVAGRFRGGPAKTAIFASGLMGMISGAPAANVSTVGTFTMPLMKKVGYKPHVAAAIESVASTGGIFTPPIMGAGAFIMAEYLGVPYLTVCLAALVPCVLYYVALLLFVDAQAVKNGLKGLPKSELPSIKAALKDRGLLGLPILFLFGAIIAGWTPTKAAFWATVMTVVVGLPNKNTRPTVKGILDALDKASRQVVPIVVTCACAGIISGVFSITGLGAKLSYSLNFLQGNANGVFIAGIFAAIIALLLGAPLPPTAVYLVMVPTIIPAIIPLGINPIAAHMFVFIYSAIGALTPPVAITAYTAAAIAKADPNQTAWLSCRYGVVAYLMPFMFIASPAVLFVGAPLAIAQAIISSFIGVLCLTIVIEGYFLMDWGKISRVIMAPAALLMLVPNLALNAAGLGVIAVAWLANRFTGPKKPTAMA